MITFSEEYLRRLADIQNEYNLKELVMLPEDEPRFIIDLDTRKIILPDEFKFLAVENDHNAETIYFEIDRYYDKQDLSQKTCIVQYKNTSDAKAIEGFYPVTKLDVDTVPGKILFGWTIENKVTVLPGSVDFSIRFYSINDSGRLPVFTYNINTLTGSLPVIDTLNTSNQGVEVIPGKVESLTAKFEALAKQAESNVLFSDDAAKKAAASAEESKANADAAKASASEAAKNAKKAAASADKSKTQADRAQSEADRAKAEAEEAADRADKAAAAAEGALIAVEETVSKALTDIESGKHTALESITHQKEDALAAVDQSKTDATGDVQTAKQEAVAAITHTGTAQTQAVTRAGEQAVKEVDAAAQAGVGSVEQAQKTATQTIQTAATAAIQRVEQTGGTQVQAVTAAGAGQVKKIEDAAAEKLEGITQLAGQAEDSATKAEQAAQRAEDAATAASTIIDDTAITPAKTWSSLRILDTLCPPIKATGNPVVCYPIEGYPLGVSVDFAPIQEGEGDPSPENVRPIKARESVDVVRCGVNVLNITPFAPIESNGIKFEYVASGGIRITGTADKLTDSPVWPLALPPGMYKMSTYENLSHQIVVTRGGEKVYLSANSPVEILRGDAVKYYYFLVNEGKPVATTIFPSLSISTVPLETAPYTGQTATLTLPTPCYGGKLDAVTGKGQETWKVIELVGTEDWLSWGVDFKTPGITGFYTYFINDYDPKQGSLALCSHILYSPFAWGGQNTGVGFSGSSPLYLVLSVKNDLLEDTSSTAAAIDSLKAYLAAQYAAGTPVTVAYIKATPTPITATGGKPIPALAGTNTLLTDGDSLTVTGREDPTHKIQQLRAAVVALGGTI